MQFARSGQANQIGVDMIAAGPPLRPIEDGEVLIFLVPCSGPNIGLWWDGESESWSEDEVPAAVAEHQSNGHWVADIGPAAWSAGQIYRVYGRADGTEIPYSSEVLCLTSTGLWPEPTGVSPVNVAEARTHLRIDADVAAEEEALLDLYLGAATRWAEMYNGRRFLLQSCVDRYDEFPRVIRPSGAPLHTVLSIVYRDPQGLEQPLEPADYQVDTATEPGRIVPGYGLSWPATRAQPQAVTVIYLAGYGLAGGDVPQPKRTAILMIAGAMYAAREEIGTEALVRVPFGAKALLGIDRIMHV